MRKGFTMKKSVKYLMFCLIICTLLSFTTIKSSAKPKISQKKISLLVSEKKSLKLVDNKSKVKWTSSNKAIATVNNKGQVKGKKAGKAIITAAVDGAKYKCKVTVKIGLDKTDITLEKGSSTKIKLCGSKIKKATSSDDSVVSISPNGEIIALSNGKASLVITGRNNKKYTCKVTVSGHKSSQKYNDSDQDKKERQGNNDSSSDDRNDSSKTEKSNDNDKSANPDYTNDNTAGNSDILDSISKAIKETNAHTIEQRKTIVMNVLNSTNNGSIDKKSIYYDSNAQSITYTDPVGRRSIYLLVAPKDGLNSSSNFSEILVPKSEIDPEVPKTKKITRASMTILYGFLERGSNEYTSMSMKDTWVNMGIRLDPIRVTNMRGLLGSQLNSNEVILFSFHGGSQKISNEDMETYIIVPERVTESSYPLYKDIPGVMKVAWHNEITNEDYERYAVTPDFIASAYSPGYYNSLVLLECCEAFGADSTLDDDLAKAFCKKGAKAVIGYHNSVSQNYSLDFYETLLKYLMTPGTTVSDAFNKTVSSKSSTGECLKNDGQYFSNKPVATPYRYGDPNLIIVKELPVPTYTNDDAEYMIDYYLKKHLKTYSYNCNLNVSRVYGNDLKKKYPNSKANLNYYNAEEHAYNGNLALYEFSCYDPNNQFLAKGYMDCDGTGHIYYSESPGSGFEADFSKYSPYY